MFFFLIYFFVFCKFFNIIYKYIINLIYKDIKILKTVFNNNSYVASSTLNTDIGFIESNMLFVCNKKKVNFYYLNLFFWLFFNKFNKFNYKYFIVFYLYYLNIINLFFFLKNNNINFFLLNTEQVSNKKILTKYLSHLFIKKKIQLLFTNNNFKINSHKMLNISIDKNLFIYFLYLNFKTI